MHVTLYMKITDTTTITATVQDPDADTVRALLKQAEEAGCTALQHVGKRLDLLCQVGDIIEGKREAKVGYHGWLNLHFAEGEVTPATIRGAVALAKSKRDGTLDLETRKGVLAVMTKTEMLPGFDGSNGVSKKPASHLTLVYRLHQHLCGMLQAELSPESRKQLKEDLRPILEVVARL